MRSYFADSNNFIVDITSCLLNQISFLLNPENEKFHDFTDSVLADQIRHMATVWVGGGVDKVILF